MSAGDPAILEAGTETGTIGIDPADAQLLESRGFSVEEICRWFCVLPYMVGHAEKSTSWGSGLEQQQIGFLTFALRPWLKRIEQSIQRSLLTPAEKSTYFAEFAIEGLLRADSKARSAFYASALNNGWMNRDEIRKLENLPPMDAGGEVFTVQSALVPIDKLGQVPAANSAADAFKQWLGIAEEETP
jgi:HK97 family phage portal protein